MGRIKKHLLVHRMNIRKARRYRNHDSDSEDTPIIDNNEYDLDDEEKAELVFKRLFQNSQNLDNIKSLRWRYTGNSVRTKQQKLRGNKLAAVGSHKITQFFGSTNVNLSNNNEIAAQDQLDYESENDPMEYSEQWEQQLQETFKRIQQLIDNANISKPDKARYISFLTEEIGRLKDELGEARVIMQLGAKNDGYWNELDITNCCARCLVANQPDFLAERGLIQKEIENRGYK
ncbi:16409_t:CDS:2, partial [Gigaspora rosea]